MDASTRRPTPRRPQGRVLRNDALVLDSAVLQLAERGWSAFSLKAVADRCNLSHQAVHDRYPDRVALAAGAYRSRLGPALESALGDLLTAFGLLPGRASIGSRPWTPFERPTPALLAAVEVVIIAQFEARLRDVVMATTAPLLRDWRTAAGAPEASPQRAYLIARALGLILTSPLPDAEFDLTPFHDHLAWALAHPAARQSIPSTPSLPAGGPLFDTGNPLHDALLAATLVRVGRDGFQGTSLTDIVADLGVTKGFVFARYRTKLELFIDATQRQHAQSVDWNVARQRAIALEFGEGIAEAMHLRDSQRPELAGARALELEQLRLTWREEPLRRAYQAEVKALISTLSHLAPTVAAAVQRVGRAVGEGAVLQAILDPDAWREPYEVVTVALHEAERRSGHAWTPAPSQSA